MRMSRMKIALIGTLLISSILGLSYFGVLNTSSVPFLSPVSIEAPTETNFERNEVDFKFQFDFDEPVNYTLLINDEPREEFTISESSSSHESTVTLDQGEYEWVALFETTSSKVEHSGMITVEDDLDNNDEGEVEEDLIEAEDETFDDAEIGDELEGEVEQ